MNLNLTCAKTHILAWINSDNTLSLKLNGVKYLAYPKLDKRGDKYWKVDGSLTETKVSTATTPSLTKEELELVASYREKVRAKAPMQAFTFAEEQAYRKWKEQKQTSSEKVKGTKSAELLASFSNQEKSEPTESLNNHEPTSP